MKPQEKILSKRERDILVLVGRGLTNQEIANQLWISIRTVKCVLYRACLKLGVRHRDQAVLKALRKQAIGIQDIFSIEELADFMSSLTPELIITVAQRVEQNIKQNHAESGTEKIIRSS